MYITDDEFGSVYVHDTCANRHSFVDLEVKKKILIIVEERYVFSLMAVSPGKLKTLILIYVSDLSLI